MVRRVSDTKFNLSRYSYVSNLQSSYRAYADLMARWYSNSGFDENGEFNYYGGALTDEITEAKKRLDKAINDLMGFDEFMKKNR